MLVLRTQTGHGRSTPLVWNVDCFGLGATAVGSIVAGVLFLRTARTGRDPFIRDSGPS